MENHHLEIEVKFLVSDLSALRERLVSLGAKQDQPRLYERNVRFDNPWDGLMMQGKLLRLRQDSSARITYKGSLVQAVESEVRIREELEMNVSDFDTAAAILERVGFVQRQVYEKYRETFEFAAVEVVLDEMPFGDFIELEGEEADIRVAADALGLDWDRRILSNYLALMAQLKERYQLAFDDLTFENFTNLGLSIAGIVDYAL